MNNLSEMQKVSLVKNTGNKKLAAEIASPPIVDSHYARYVLVLLVVMAIFNFIDRQILAILAEDIKADLGLSDSDLGFLYGTAFAVFYAVFGISLGRLADSWNRKRLISISVVFWSLMTALSGLARGFLPLSLCRFGVGVGEAGASPAALSLLYDYFSPKIRTTVVGLFSSGGSIGAGLGLFLGGSILAAWNGAWPDATMAPFGLKGWQVAFMAVGLPGLLLAVILWFTVKEPVRGQADNLSDVQESGNTAVPENTLGPLRTLVSEILPMLPGINLWALWHAGAGRKAILLNLIVALCFIVVVAVLIAVTNEFLQWTALSIGMYCAFSWAQRLLCKDIVCFTQIFRCKTVISIYVYNGLNYFCYTAIGFWIIPWFQRHFGISAAEVGTILGLSFASGALIGVILGGVIADKMRKFTQKGKLYTALAACILWLFVAFTLLSTQSLHTAYILVFFSALIHAIAAAPAASTVTDLMIPISWAVAMALFMMTTYFLGYALGPYFVGVLSDTITATGVDSSIALRNAMMLSLIVMCVAIIFLIVAIKHVAADENTCLERARALGEAI